jgi:ribosomal-protein-alanine N-acetyltransferase
MMATGLLETPRLILRPLRETDAEVFHVWFGDAEVMRYYPSGPARTLADTSSHIRNIIAKSADHSFGRRLILEKVSGTAIGDCSITTEQTGETMLGCRLAKTSWGKGYATEATYGCLQYGFERLQYPRLTAFTHPENTSAIRVLEGLEFQFHRRELLHDISWMVYEKFRAISG